MKDWLTVFAVAIAALVIIGWVSWIGQARGGWEATVTWEDTKACDYPESLLTDALASEPERLVLKLEGKFLSAFLSKMEAAGYLSGSLPNVTSLYIIRGKLLPSYHEPIDILFFIDNQGCIVGKVYGTASVVEEMLPCGRYCRGSEVQ